MTSFSLAIGSLRHYRRDHTALAIMIALCAAIISGALLVGHSVRESLKENALSRLGPYRHMIAAGEYTMSQSLAERMSRDLEMPVSGILSARGIVRLADGSSQANKIGIFGIDSGFAEVAGIPALDDGEAALSDTLARQLNANAGDSMIVRIPSPSALPTDSALRSTDTRTVALRVTVKSILPASGLGRFSMANNHTPPKNIFLPRKALQNAMEAKDRINLILLQSAEADTSRIDDALKAAWTMDDAELTLHHGEISTLISRRVLIPRADSRAILEAIPDARPQLTWFVNAIHNGDRSVPYSMVSALPREPGTGRAILNDRILVNGWLAEELEIQNGDRLKLEFFSSGHGDNLNETNASFSVSGTLDMQTLQAAGPLTPDIPGLTDTENCRDWDPDLPVDFEKLTERDEAYWDEYGTLPKAVITYESGRDIWQSRHGETTAIRFPGNVLEASAITIPGLDPANRGIRSIDRIALTLQSVDAGVDFSGLFIGFSWFIILSALILTAQFFRLSMERRNDQSALMRGLGFSGSRLIRLYLLEASLVCAPAAFIGALGGSLYAQSILHQLTTRWTGATGITELRFHQSETSLAIGALTTAALCLIVTLLTARSWLSGVTARRLSAKEEILSSPSGRRNPFPMLIATQGLLLCLVLPLVPAETSTTAKGLYFGAGAGLLLFLAVASRSLMLTLQQDLSRLPGTTGGLAIRNLARRPGRSFTVITCIASGLFLVLAVGGNRSTPSSLLYADTVALYAESAVPLYIDLNDSEERDKLGLPDALPPFAVTPFRLRPGDDSSCLNLGRAQTPTIIATDTDQDYASALTPISVHRGHTYTDPFGIDPYNFWSELAMEDLPDDIIPVAGDEATTKWGLGMNLGSKLPIQNDYGKQVHLELQAVITDSPLQGFLLTDRRFFEKHFPEHGGAQVFLISIYDTNAVQVADLWVDGRPYDSVDEHAAAWVAGPAARIAESLTVALEDVGFSVVPVAERIAQFKEVENTYLSVFGILGGIGVLLGIAGMAAITLRNMSERQTELGIMRALGYTRRSLGRMLMIESGLLILAGTIAGVAAGLLAIWPAITASGSTPPWSFLIGGTLMTLLTGLLFSSIGVSIGLRQNLQKALRYE